MTDLRGSAAYRRAMVGRLLEKCVADTASAGEPVEAAPMNQPVGPIATAPVVGASLPHESAVGHVTGAARYVDDLWPDVAHVAHALAGAGAARARAGRCDRRRGARASAPGVLAVLTGDDVPGENDIGRRASRRAAVPDRGLLRRPGRRVGDRRDRGAGARSPPAAVRVDYEALPAILVDRGRHRRRTASSPPAIGCHRGDAEARAARRRRIGSTASSHIGGQEHFYLETNAALAYRDRRRRA